MLRAVYKLNVVKYGTPLVIEGDSVLLLHLVSGLEGWTWTLLSDEEENLWEILPEVSSHKLEAVQSLPVVATLQQGVFDALIADPAFIPYILGFKQSVSGKQ